MNGWRAAVAVCCLVSLASPAAPQGSSAATLYPGQTGNRLQITVSNLSTDQTLTGVRLFTPSGTPGLVIDSITPKSALLEPGRSDTFTIVFSVAEAAEPGSTASATFAFSADQPADFDFPSPQLSVTVGDPGDDQLSSLRSRLARLEELRLHALAARRAATGAAGGAPDDERRADALADAVKEASAETAGAKEACERAVVVRSELEAVSARAELAAARSTAIADRVAASPLRCGDQAALDAARRDQTQASALADEISALAEAAGNGASRHAEELASARRGDEAVVRARAAVDSLGELEARSSATARTTGDAVADAVAAEEELVAEHDAWLTEADRVRSRGVDLTRLDELVRRAAEIATLPETDLTRWIIETEDGALRISRRAEDARRSLAELEPWLACDEGPVADLLDTVRGAYKDARFALRSVTNRVNEFQSCDADAANGGWPTGQREPGAATGENGWVSGSRTVERDPCASPRPDYDAAMARVEAAVRSRDLSALATALTALPGGCPGDAGRLAGLRDAAVAVAEAEADDKSDKMQRDVGRARARRERTAAAWGRLADDLTRTIARARAASDPSPAGASPSRTIAGSGSSATGSTSGSTDSGGASGCSVHVQLLGHGEQVYFLVERNGGNAYLVTSFPKQISDTDRQQGVNSPRDGVKHYLDRSGRPYRIIAEYSSQAAAENAGRRLCSQ